MSKALQPSEGIIRSMPGFITHCAGCYLPVICQWLCLKRSFVFLISFSWTQYQTLNTIIYLVHRIDILLYISHFISILNDLWRRDEAKLLSATAKWQITGAHQLPFLDVAVQWQITFSQADNTCQFWWIHVTL